MRQTLAIAAGGALGAVARYEVGRLVAAHWVGLFPLGTLLANLLGALALGAIMVASVERGVLSTTARLSLGVGFCGGFTTFSTWMVDSYRLLAQGHDLAALVNLAVSIGAGLLAVALGALLAGVFIRPRRAG